jgi:hypothetical protein
MDKLVGTVKNELTFENVLTTAMKTPGVKINRSQFLRKELIKYCPESQIIQAIKYNPAKAGISREMINKISKSVIDFETTKVTGLSIAASLPGGIAAVGAAAADITSYFVFILRTLQELSYLYGFDEFDFSEDNVDAETMNFITIFLGVMFGVQGTSAALQKIANNLAKQVSKKLPQKALTKGTIYPVVKKIATKAGNKMTKQIFADSLASAIPIAGGLLSGGLTYATFKPACMKLRKNLMSYTLSDPEFYKTNVDDIIDVFDESL